MPLPAIRYMLMLIPSIAGLYLANISSYSVYVVHTLLLIGLAQLRFKRSGHTAGQLLLWGEIGYSGWLALTYGGLFYILPFSTLVSVYAERGRQGLVLIASALFILLNVSVLTLPASTRIAVCLAFAALAAVLHLLRTASSETSKAETYNDELRRKHYELEEARNRIADYAAKVEHLAQTEERNRIARDIHDELGHRLVRLKMMMDAACAVIPTRPEKGFELVVEVRDQLADSMDILRKTVRNMKPGEAKRPYSLAALIEELGKTNGIELSFDTEGMPYPLYPSEEIVLYRNAQEAVTNAIRHGGADRFRIAIRYGPQQVTMTVANNGTVPASISSKGLGLSGMEERIKLLGGSLEIGLEPEFAVTTVIPRSHRAEPLAADKE